MSAAGKRNRYPGLQPFEVQDERLFYGREREARDLCAQVMVERMVVLFSKSGMGKFSLLNAGLTPLLEKTNILPLRIRLSFEQIPPEHQFLLQLEEQKDNVLLDASLSRKTATLWEQVKFARFTKNGVPAVPLFLLDQFEEVFTLYTPAQRQRFLEEIADLANGSTPERYQQNLRERIARGENLSGQEIIELEQAPRVKIIFSIRSDLLHLLNALSPFVPDIMRSRFELQPLTVEQAEEAIVLPAMLRDPERSFESRIFQYEEESLHLMLDYLTKRGQEDVESFQLQILCRYIERLVIEKQNVGSGAGQTAAKSRVNVTPELFGKEQGIETILRNFYTDQIAALPQTEQPVARKIIEEELITESERRRSVSEDDLSQLGAARPLLDRLVEMRLLRKEPRLKTFYYEISHDTLVPPILVKYKERRLEEEQDAALRKSEAERLDNIRKAKEAEAKAQEEARKRAEAERLQKEAELAQREAERQRKIADDMRVIAEKQMEMAEAQRRLAELGRRRALRLTRWAVGVSVLAVAATLYAYILQKQAKENLQNFFSEQAKNTETQYREYISRGDEMRETGFYQSAREMYMAADTLAMNFTENEYLTEHLPEFIKQQQPKLKADIHKMDSLLNKGGQR